MRLTMSIYSKETNTPIKHAWVVVSSYKTGKNKGGGIQNVLLGLFLPLYPYSIPPHSTQALNRSVQRLLLAPYQSLLVLATPTLPLK